MTLGFTFASGYFGRLMEIEQQPPSMASLTGLKAGSSPLLGLGIFVQGIEIRAPWCLPALAAVIVALPRATLVKPYRCSTTPNVFARPFGPPGIPVFFDDRGEADPITLQTS